MMIDTTVSTSEIHSQTMGVAAEMQFAGLARVWARRVDGDEAVELSYQPLAGGVALERDEALRTRDFAAVLVEHVLSV